MGPFFHPYLFLLPPSPLHLVPLSLNGWSTGPRVRFKVITTSPAAGGGCGPSTKLVAKGLPLKDPAKGPKVQPLNRANGEGPEKSCDVM